MKTFNPLPRHGYLILFVVGFFLCSAAGNAQSTSATVEIQPRTTPRQRAALVQTLVDKYGERLVKVRYMQKNGEPVAWPGWEGLPTLKCRYPVTDKANNNTKFAEVVMLNAPPEKVANWIVTAVNDAQSTQPDVDADRLFKHIISQSGGQFPIAGVVYEDMEGDGFFKAYCFRNGVTTRIEGIPHRTTETLTAKETEASLRGPITRVYTYARIASTTPDQYRAWGGKVDVGTNKERTKAWPEVVGKLYREAWNSNRNELISAWARANL